MARSRLFVTTRRPTPRPRRGIILLFVLALLALFSLVTVTFVLVARQAKLSSLSSAAADRHGDSYAQQLNGAAMQALRGTNNPMSVLRPHSLLEDMYGNDGIAGTVVDGTTVLDSNVTLDNTSYPSTPPTYTFNGPLVGQVQKFLVQFDANLSVPLFQYNGAYAGRTVTMLSGAAAGRTSRVLESEITNVTVPNNHAAPHLAGPTHILHVLSFGPLVTTGDRVLINGAPFNGAGFGYGFTTIPPSTNPATLYLDARTLDFVETLTGGVPIFPEHALMPNSVFFIPSPFTRPAYTDAAGPGGADEDYDAVDYQNMILALHIPNALVTNAGVPVPIPSLHRPELLFYWMVKTEAAPIATNMTTLTASSIDTAIGSISDTTKKEKFKRLIRRSMLRPWGGTAESDHPKFTGSNPGFNPFSLGSLTDAGRWDVDNDNDGVCDSIWVDLGSPVQTAPDGRKYKPLYALMVIEQDSKFNLNAHGTLAQINYNSDGINSTSIDITAKDWNGPYAGTGTMTLMGVKPGTTPAHRLSMGRGYGPAEINLGFLFDATSGTNAVAIRNEVARVLTGGVYSPTGELVEGRYGESYQLATNPAGPGYTAAPTPKNTDGTASWGDWIDDLIRNFDLPANYFNTAGIPFPSQVTGVPPAFGSWGSPPDLNGNSGLGLDARGMPWYGDIYGRYTSFMPPIPRSVGFGEWTSAIDSDKVNDPYEIDLSWSGRQKTYLSGTVYSTVDNPFTPGELERLLRFNDADAAALPSRLLKLGVESFYNGLASATNPLLDAAYRRSLVTTESWDTPAPTTIMPPDAMAALLQTIPTAADLTPEQNVLANLLGNGAFDVGAQQVNTAAQLNFTELVRRRMLQAGYAFGDSMIDPGKTRLANALRQLVSWDLAQGLRLDLNRPLGNGVDGNSNDIVDEPKELESATEALWPQTSLSSVVGIANDSEMKNPLMDHNNDGVAGVNTTSASPSWADKSDLYARQLLARHLYLLAWTIVDPTQGTAPTDRDAIKPLVNTDRDTPVKARAALAKRLAQWAVNMVDYRDRDSIMTPFEYDIYPFSDETGDGLPWDVDDDPATNPETAPADLAGLPVALAANRGVVWGCERPELLLTETFAFHNVRTADRTGDNGIGKLTTDMSDPDPTLDQVKRPLSGLFVEVYAPWNRTESPSPEVSTYAQHAFDLTQSSWQVHLSKLSGTTTSETIPSPVWRLVITKTYKLDEPPEHSEWDGADPTGHNANIERTVYFVPEPETLPTNTDHRRPYYRHKDVTTEVYVAPNTYALIGPNDNSNQIDVYEYATSDTPSTAKITFNMSPASAFELTGLTPAYPVSTPLATARIKQVLPVPIEGPRRLSISEPYPAEGALPADPGNGSYAAWELSNPIGSDAPLTTIDDEPWDLQNADLPHFYGTTEGNDDANDASGGPPSWRTVYLQRLADPTRPWHRRRNPYLSVDRMPVDLTVYNSETNIIPGANKLPPDFEVEPGNNDYRFGTRQRGKLEVSESNLTSVSTFNIWASNPCKLAPDGEPTKADFNHSLGYMNDPTKVFVVKSPTDIVSYPLRLVNDTAAPGVGETANYYGDDYVGDPSTPFPWLNWTNRPYVSKHELLQVPATFPHEMLAKHSVRHPSNLATALAADRSAYWIPTQAETDPNTIDMFAGLQFGYVSPLFMSTWYVASNEQYTLPNLHRLLEFVTVPSRFAGTEKLLDSAAFQTGSATDPSEHRFNPPFNRVSALREPGKININMITDPRVWRAIMNSLQDGTPVDVAASSESWNKLVASRRGYGLNVPANPSVIEPYIIDAAIQPKSAVGGPLPTFFANPFRSYGGLYLVPLPELQINNFDIGLPAAMTVVHPSVATGAWKNEIDTTLMRVDHTTYPSGIPRPLFAYNPKAAGDIQLNHPTAYSNKYSPVMPFADPIANPTFHYQSIQKLSNLVTTRSNVYAMWITVGYFEVERGPIDGGHPDGWRLGAEMGIDTGDVKRHRAFYLIDRSIPVGFQRGEDTNVQDTILLKRIIE